MARDQVSARVVANAHDWERLQGSDVRLELCDKDGRSLGHFVGHFEPSPGITREAYDWARAEIPEEEIQRAFQEPGGLTTAELLERLGRS